MPHQALLLDASKPARASARPRAVPSFEPIAVRVARGARQCDELRPGWASSVDRDRLDVQDATGSPEAQIWGSVAAGLVALFDPREVVRVRMVRGQEVVERSYRGIETRQLVALGLCADPGQGDEYGAINEAWRAEVAARMGRTGGR